MKRLFTSTFGRLGLFVLIGLFLLSFPLPFAYAQEEEQTEEPLISARGEMWLQSSGGGNAVLDIKVSQALLDMGFTLDAFTQDIQSDESAEVTSAQDLGGGNYRVAFKWADGKKFFGEDSVILNPDGTITVDLGDLGSFEALTVHVQGNITETAGEKISNDTAIFKNSNEGTVTFKPSGAITPPPTTPPTGTPPPTTQPPTTPPTGFTPPSTQQPTPSPTGGPAPSGGGLSTTWIIIIAFAALFVLAIIVLIVSLSMRKRRPPQAGYPYAAPPPPPPQPQAGPAPGYMFCPKCGRQIQYGTRFCPFCGFQIGAPTPPQAPPSSNIPENPPPPPEAPQS